MKIIGEYIDYYRIREIKATFPTCILYLVEDTHEADGPFVLKSWSVVCQTPSLYQLFNSQAHALANLEASCFVPIADYGVDENEQPFLVFPYESYSFQTLQQRLEHSESEPISEDEARAILAQVGTALVLAHQSGLVHGSLSPEDILFTPEGEVRVAGFAPSIVYAPQQRSTLRPLYRPPEAEATCLSDQYALGGLARELLLDRRSAPSLSLSAEQAIARAQSQAAGQRFRSVREFLQQLGIELPIQEKAAEYDPQPFMFQRETLPGALPFSTRPHPVRSKRARWLAVFAALVLVLGGIVMISYNHQQQVLATQAAAATATAASIQATRASQTVVAQVSATSAAYQSAMAAAGARAFPPPFNASGVFHDDLSQENENWDGAGCNFGDQSYSLAADAGNIVGCPRKGTEYENATTTPYAFQIVFADLGGSGSVGILFNVQAGVIGGSGDMFLINKHGNYEFCNATSAGFGFCGSPTGTVSFPITFPLSIGVIAQSNHCVFYVNGKKVVQDTANDRFCNGALGAAIGGGAKGDQAHFSEANLWDFTTP